jgi:uncharacterized membrane protein
MAPSKANRLVSETESLTIVVCIMFLFLISMVSVFFLFVLWLVIPLFVLGIFIGYFVSRKMTENQLKTITKIGVYTTTRKYWVSLIGVISLLMVVLIALLLVFHPNYYFAVIVWSFFPMVPTVGITRLIIYRRWEQNNNRTLYYTTGIHGKIWPYPYMFENQIPETQNQNYKPRDRAPS